MKYIAIIPSRYDSTRFPGKALTLIKGIPMIQRVYEQVIKTKGLDQTYVATDDMRIARVIEESGGDVIMTSADHPSGTSRCNEAMSTLLAGGLMDPDDIIINVQGDEPFIDPKQIELVMGSFKDEEVRISTLVKPIETEEELFDENVVKVVLDKTAKALLFSRQAVPYCRGIRKEHWLSQFEYLKHIGLYAYRAAALEEISRLQGSRLQEAESLEQLVWLEHGYDIHTRKTSIDSIGVDVPDDLLKFDKET
jgi:3-deoxy-manno-octulosonate cytidylyltransferase (CMP-KDO synthetase)